MQCLLNGNYFPSEIKTGSVIVSMGVNPRAFFVSDDIASDSFSPSLLHVKNRMWVKYFSRCEGSLQLAHCTQSLLRVFPTPSNDSLKGGEEGKRESLTKVPSLSPLYPSLSLSFSLVQRAAQR